MKTTQGFFLWELTIGMVLLLLASSLIGHWYHQYRVLHSRLQARTKALFLASSLLEQLKAGSYPPQKKGIYRIALQQTPDPALPSFYHVNITLSWEDQYLTLISGLLR